MAPARASAAGRREWAVAGAPLGPTRERRRGRHGKCSGR
jgi:hypothetical protein